MLEYNDVNADHLKNYLYDFVKSHKNLILENEHMSDAVSKRAIMIIRYREMIDKLFATKVLTLCSIDGLLDAPVSDILQRYGKGIVHLDEAERICVGPVTITKGFSVIVHGPYSRSNHAVASRH